MHTLRFPIRREHRHKVDGARPTEPVLELRLQPRHSEVVVDVLAVVDTGSEQTTLDGKICRDIGLDLTAGVPTRMRTFGGAVQVYLHPVRVSLVADPHESFAREAHDLFRPFSLDVAFTLDPAPRNVLGRDFLEHFVVALDEKRGLLYLGHSPDDLPAAA